MQKKKLKDNNNKIIEGALEIIPEIFFDERGYFYETWNYKNFNNLIESNINFVQDNQSFSKKNTLRGLHFQLNPSAQGKLVKVTQGEVFDVIVDLRQSSKTFLSWAGILLTSKLKNQIWVPEGFAHGFLTLSQEAIVEYKVTNFWDKELERTLIWNDSSISIDWPKSTDQLFKANLSPKDNEGKTLDNLLKEGECFK